MSTKLKEHEKEKESRPFQLCIFDERRGQIEGEEGDRILAYFPPETPAVDQTALVGLVQAMLAFTSLFSLGSPCETIHTSRWRGLTLPCGTGLWMLLVVERSWQSGPIRDEGLRVVLHHILKLCTLMHGPLQRLLDQDATGETARRVLQPCLVEMGTRYLKAKPGETGPLHNPLGMGERLPFLSLPRALFTGMQAFVDGLLVAYDGSGHPAIMSCLLMHNHFCLWSTLCKRDTMAVYRFAVTALLPAVQRATQPSLGERFSSSFRSGSSRSGDRNLLDKKSWQLLSNGALVLTPSDPASAAIAGSREDSVEIPHVWLQDGEERCGLLPFAYGDVLLVLLLGDRVAASGQLLSSIAEASKPALTRLSAGVTDQLAASNRWHVPGYRYMFQDRLLNTVVASPASKVATLSRDSLALLTSVREEMEDHSMSGDAEVMVRAAHDCWAVGRRTGDRSLTLVLEQHSSAEGLLDASTLTDVFIDKYFSGLLD